MLMHKERGKKHSGEVVLVENIALNLFFIEYS
jgi:hypothetical protein